MNEEMFQAKLKARRVNPHRFKRLHIFYHAAALGNYLDVMQEQLTFLANAGLPRQSIDSFHINFARTQEEIDQYEIPCIRKIQNLCRSFRSPEAILYFHTKGVSAPEHKGKAHWRRLMMRYVIGYWRENLVHLQDHDMVGCNWQDCGVPNFCGNFWLARSDWINCLPDIDAYQKSQAGTYHAGQKWERICAEMWLGSVNYHHIYSLCCRNECWWDGPRIFDFKTE